MAIASLVMPARVLRMSRGFLQLKSSRASSSLAQGQGLRITRYEVPVVKDKRALKASKQKAKAQPKAPSPEVSRSGHLPRYDASRDIKKRIGEVTVSLSPILLRDLCSCDRCLDPSTKQKLFCTSDIPATIQARSVTERTDGGLSITWNSDVPGYREDHVTELSPQTVATLGWYDTVKAVEQPLTARELWTDEQFRALADFNYDSYMADDEDLWRAVQQLHTHGLIFIKNVPEDPESVTAVAERIGPLKTTFYGKTWDVRSVPEAKNVAYTSQNLGFHMDLMYMEQPPHLQLLHCIRSSSAGGASTFSDSFAAVAHLAETNDSAFEVLSSLPVNFHYNHPDSNMYHQVRTVIEKRVSRPQKKAKSDKTRVENGEHAEPSPPNVTTKGLDRIQSISAVSWAPPFQAPFSSLRPAAKTVSHFLQRASTQLNNRISAWHAAAQIFRGLVHRPEYVHERLMQPGECVIFDNRRVLHGRKEFDVDDAGKERWLRGAYIDKDPYMSKMRVLHRRFAKANTPAET